MVIITVTRPLRWSPFVEYVFRPSLRPGRCQLKPRDAGYPIDSLLGSPVPRTRASARPGPGAERSSESAVGDRRCCRGIAMINQRKWTINQSINQSGFNIRFLTRRWCQGRLERTMQLQALSHHLKTPDNAKTEEKARSKTVQVR